MMIKSFITGLILAAHMSSAFSAEKIRSYQVVTNPLKMNSIAAQFEVVKKLERGFEVYVTEERLKEFLKLAPRARLLQKNIHDEHLGVRSFNAGKYRKFAEVEGELKAMATTFNQVASLETYGTSKGGRKLYALKISTASAANRPKLLVTAATHGDELITTEVLFALTHELLNGLGKDERLTKILNARDIYIIPVVSPDSFENRERYVQGKDPNRSFPWPGNVNNAGVDVITALMNYTDKMKFTGSLDLHAYGKLVMYPWGYTTVAPQASDEGGFRDLVQSMARENQYEAGQISTTIYIAKGSSADYFYWRSGTKAIAAELGTQKIPAYGTIPQVVAEAREMVWTFLEYFN